MRVTFYGLASLLLPAAVSGFKETSPLIIWSSQSAASLQEVAKGFKSSIATADEAYATISHLGCDWNNLVIAYSEGLHQSLVPSLNLHSSADLHIPYVKKLNRHSFEMAVNGLVSSCAERHTGQSVQWVPIAEGSGLSAALDSLPAHDLLILTGSATSLSKRQEAPFPSPSPDPEDPQDPQDPQEPQEPQDPQPSGPINTTLPTTGPLLQRAQFFTAPIITGLLVTFLIFMPILYLGINALVSIQVPPRMLEIGKGMTVGKERKDQ